MRAQGTLHSVGSTHRPCPRGGEGGGAIEKIN